MIQATEKKKQKKKKNERNNEQCKHNMPLQILGSGGIKYQNQRNFCRNNRSLIRSWRFLD